MNIEGYEYKIQYNNPVRGWENTWTNQYAGDEWYPNEKGAKNALAQMRATRYGRVKNAEDYRLIRRPYGPWEEYSA